MWIANELVQELDTPAGRKELARLATEAARKASGSNAIEILWNGMWIRKAEGVYFPDPDLFSVAEPRWDRWTRMASKYLRDAEDYWFHIYSPREGDTIVDIGAGRGEDVYAFSRKVGDTGHVWAIEAHPLNYRALCLFSELNDLHNVSCLNFACVDSPAMLQVETLPVWESNFVHSGEATPTSFPVEGMRFDSLAAEQGIDHIDFLKMNIEGAERTALPGCKEVLKVTRHVCIAAHDFRAERGEGDDFRTLEFVRDYLTDAGFELITRDEDPRYYVPFHVHGVRKSED